MISLVAAGWIVRMTGVYLLIGLLCAVPFAWRWSGRLDPVAAHGTLGFRLLLLPGAILLWPLVLARVLRASR